MDFIIGLPRSADWRGDGYDSILVIVDWLTKIVYYEFVQTIITALALVEVILNVVVQYHSLPDSIVSNCGSVFTSKFWSSLCYFLSIRQKLSIAFYFQTNSQTEQRNSTMKAYLRAFINYEKNNWVRLLPMAEFAYNNVKYASTGYMPFEPNCEYYPCVSYKEDVDPRSKSKATDELNEKLRNLMVVCRKNL